MPTADCVIAQSALLKQQVTEMISIAKHSKLPRAGTTIENLGTHIFTVDQALGTIVATGVELSEEEGKRKRTVSTMCHT
jgi:hypothetical protein